MKVTNLSQISVSGFYEQIILGICSFCSLIVQFLDTCFLSRSVYSFLFFSFFFWSFFSRREMEVKRRTSFVCLVPFLLFFFSLNIHDKNSLVGFVLFF